MSECSLRCRNGEHTFQRATALEDRVDGLGQWQTFEPPLYADGNAEGNYAGPVGLGAGGRRVGKWIRIGHLLFLRYFFAWGSQPWNGRAGLIYTELPPGLSASVFDQVMHCRLWIHATVSEDWAGSALVPTWASWRIYPQFPLSYSDCHLGYYRIAADAGANGTGIPQVPDMPEGGHLLIQGTVEID